MANNNPFTSNFRFSSESRARNLASARRAVPLEAAASNSTSTNVSSDSFSRFRGLRSGAGARAFRRNSSIFNNNTVNRGLRDRSSLGAHTPGTGDVAEPTGASGVSFRSRGTHSLNNRAERRFSFGSGLSGRSNGRGLLGNHEPGSAIREGVTRGTLDKQGNPSIRPRFGADSRVAADAEELGLGMACAVGAWDGARNGYKTPGPQPVKAAVALAGVFIGCARAMVAKQVTDAIVDAKAEKPENNEEEGKKAKEKDVEDKKVTDKEEEGKKAKEKEDDADKESRTTPKPDDDNAYRRRNLSFEELAVLSASGSRSLTNPGNEDDSSISMRNVGLLDPFSRVEARRGTLIRPSNEGSFRGGNELPSGNAGDSLIQPPDSDENNPTPASPSEDN